MKATVIDGIDAKTVKYLDNLLLEKYQYIERIKLLPAAFYQSLPPFHLAAWAGINARYVIPTQELVYWLKKKINGRKAIEIGSGNGDLGYHLGIHMTDNYSQLRPEVQSYYALGGQRVTQPNGLVEQIDAIDAVIKHRPDVVVGAYITQKAYEDTKMDSGNVYGPEEGDILWRTDCYIHVGNEVSHGNKRIRKYTHTVYHPDWLVTRSLEPQKNSIYVWNGLSRY